MADERPEDRVDQTVDERSFTESESSVSLCILLSGGITPSPLAVASGKAVVNLHLTPNQTVLDLWHSRIIELLDFGDMPPIVLLHAGESVPPDTMALDGISLDRDSGEYRGPAGAVRDAVGEEFDNSYLLLIESGSFMREPLSRLKDSESACNADIIIGTNADSSPAGVYLIKRSAFGLVPKIGFMDLKEQFFTKASEAGFRIAVANMGPQAVTRIRTRSDVLRASALANSSRRELADGGPTVVTKDVYGVSCVCEGATVSPDAIVVDSLVMPGARVSAGAIVARSVLFRGANAREDESYVEQYVTERASYNDSEIVGNDRIKR